MPKTLRNGRYRLYVELEAELDRRMRLYLLENGRMTPQEFVPRLIEDYLDQQPVTDASHPVN